MKRHAPDDTLRKRKLMTRLRSVEGHFHAVVNMVDEDTYCVDVLQQTKAIHSALSKIERLLLDRHLQHCVTTAVRSDDPRERERILDELLTIFDARQSW